METVTHTEFLLENVRGISKIMNYLTELRAVVGIILKWILKDCVEVYLHSPNTPSWRGAQFKGKSTGTTLPVTLS
jgi:hypothetical protein